MKKMFLEKNWGGQPGYNLVIEKDAGNPIAVAMGGREDNQHDNWRQLRALCDNALEGLGVRRTKASKAAADLARALEDLMTVEGGEPQAGNACSEACWSAATRALRAWRG